jgi:hypothetical protein
MAKTLLEHWGPTLQEKRTAARLDFRVFPKAGTYRAVWLIPSEAWSEKAQKGYALDEEIKEAEEAFHKYLNTERDMIAQMRSKREKAKWWEWWLDLYKTTEKVLARLDEWEAQLEALERANTPTEMKETHVPTTSPGTWNDKKLIFGKNGWPIVKRGHLVQDLEKAGPNAILKLTNMGVVLDDKPGWAESAKQTKNALAFLESREKSLFNAMSAEAEKIRNNAKAVADKALLDAKVKYPLVDPELFRMTIPQILVARK